MDIADTRVSPAAAAAVTALYAEHALGLVRLAVVMLGDRGACLGTSQRLLEVPGACCISRDRP